MVTLAEVLRRYGPAYLNKFGPLMPATHRQALQVLKRCGTGELGYALYRCSTCHSLEVVPRSCGNRHCPACQAHQAHRWLRRQLQRLLPCPYFLITFTVPQELRGLIRSNQKIAYEAMFQAAVEALRLLALDADFVGADQLGLLAVLHTWGRTMDYHPHIHMLVPAGGLSKDRRQWHAARAQFFVPVKALSPIYRKKMRHALEQADLIEDVPSSVWDSDWVVHSKPAGDGQHCVRYLAAYAFRVAISNHRIVSCDDGRVVFQYRKSGSNRWRKMDLDAMEFLRRFLQHVLPTGFMKVRHYGFLSANGTPPTGEIEQLIEDYYAGLVEKLSPEDRELPDLPEVTCPRCGGPMRLLRVVFRSAEVICDSG